jgi:hypothetical protein
VLEVEPKALGLAPKADWPNAEPAGGAVVLVVVELWPKLDWPNAELPAGLAPNALCPNAEPAVAGAPVAGVEVAVLPNALWPNAEPAGFCPKDDWPKALPPVVPVLAVLEPNALPAVEEEPNAPLLDPVPNALCPNAAPPVVGLAPKLLCPNALPPFDAPFCPNADWPNVLPAVVDPKEDFPNALPAVLLLLPNED